MKKPKIVERMAIPLSHGHVLFLEKDKIDEVYCTIYEENKHMTQREIAKAMGCTEPVVCDLMKQSLRKFYNTVKKGNRRLNPIEITTLVGEMLNVKTDVQFKKFFRALPNDIKREVSEYAEKNYS